MKKLTCSGGKSCTIEDVDLGSRRVKFRPAVFNSVDSWNRAYSPKAFNRTLKNSGGIFPHLIEHNPELVVGKTLEAGTDEKGVWVVSKIANTPRGDEALQLYNEGIYNSHSFAGYVIQSNPQTIDGQQVEYVTEASMYEVTTTLFPANPQAGLLGIENALRVGALTYEQLLALGADHSDSAKEDEEEGLNDLINYIKTY